jgi:hypothetical protein
MVHVRIGRFRAGAAGYRRVEQARDEFVPTIPGHLRERVAVSATSVRIVARVEQHSDRVDMPFADGEL